MPGVLEPLELSVGVVWPSVDWVSFRARGGILFAATGSGRLNPLMAWSLSISASGFEGLGTEGDFEILIKDAGVAGEPSVKARTLPFSF